jgi:predicted PurR-regulated permease PerM
MREFPLYFRITCYMLILVMFFFTLYIASSLLVPLALGILLTFLLLPVSNWLETLRFPRFLAILTSLFLMAVILTGLIFFLSNQFLSFTEELPFLRERLGQKFNSLQQFIEDNFQVSNERQVEWLRDQVEALLSSSGQIFGDIFSATGNFLAAATLIPIYIFFFSYYRYRIIGFVRQLTPVAKHDEILSMLHRTSQVSQKYMVGLIIDISILSVLNSIGFLILGIKHAILLGVVAGILNIIPYVGVLIGSLFPIAMALITKDSIWYAVGALGVCAFVQFLDNNFITPNVVGSAVSINPPATMIALLVGGMIWGVAGMMLFIPYLGMLKVIFDHLEPLRPIGYLIGDDKKVKKKPKIASSDSK